MTHDAAPDVILHARHFAFVCGILGRNPKNDTRDYHFPTDIGPDSPGADYRMAFRELNRLFIKLKAHRGTHRRS